MDKTRIPDPKAANRLAVVGLFIVWIAFIFPMLQGKVFLPLDLGQNASAHLIGNVSSSAPRNDLENDAVLQYYPWRSWLRYSLRRGHIPLWDPFRLAGTPYAANSQMAIWYPPNWLFAVLSLPAAFTIIYAGSLAVALLLAYWFFRQLKLHPFAAFGGSVVYVTSGFLMAWAMHPTFLASAMWLPLVLGGLETGFQGRPLRGIPLGALGLGLSILGGHTEVTLFVLMAAGCWTLARLLPFWGSSEPSHQWPKSIFVLCAILGLGAIIAAPQVVLSLELSRQIIRQPHPFAQLQQAALPVKNLLTLFLPDAFGNPVDRNFVGIGNYTETSFYAGVAAIAFGLVAILMRWRDRVVVSFVAIASLGLFTALGSPMARLLYSSVPLVPRLGNLTRFGYLIDVGLAGLTGVGIDQLFSRRGRGLPYSVFLATTLVLVAILISTVLVATRIPIQHSYLVPQTIRALLIVISAGVLAYLLAIGVGPAAKLSLLLMTLIAGDLWTFGFHFHSFQGPVGTQQEPAAVKYLRFPATQRHRIANEGGWWIPPNGFLEDHIFGIEGYDSYILKRTEEIVSLAKPSGTDANLVGAFSSTGEASSILDLLGVDTFVSSRAPAGSDADALNYQLSAYGRPKAFPPAFLVECWGLAPPANSLAMLANLARNGELRSWAIVDRTVAGLKFTPSRAADCRPGPEAEIREYAPEGVRLAARPVVPSLLMLTDSWYPGWRVHVDGKPRRVLLVDHALRGVILRPGLHEITFTFQPSWLKSCVGLSLMGVALTLLLLKLARSGLGNLWHSERNRKGWWRNALY